MEKEAGRANYIGSAAGECGGEDGVAVALTCADGRCCLDRSAAAKLL